MTYRRMFLDAIAGALNGTDYRFIDGEYYIYKREVGIVISVTYDTYWNMNGFHIEGSLSSFCGRRSITRYGLSNDYFYELNVYAYSCGLPRVDEVNPLLLSGSLSGYYIRYLRRYPKELLAENLQRTMELLKKSMLADFLGIESMEDYYNFIVKHRRIICPVEIPSPIEIPSPTEDAFFLCILLGKLKEASHIYLRFLYSKEDYGPYIEVLNEVINLKPVFRDIQNALDGIEPQTNSGNDALIRFEEEAEVVETILRKHEAVLKEETQNRINESRIICDRYFAEK